VRGLSDQIRLRPHLQRPCLVHCGSVKTFSSVRVIAEHASASHTNGHSLQVVKGLDRRRTFIRQQQLQFLFYLRQHRRAALHVRDLKHRAPHKTAPCL